MKPADESPFIRGTAGAPGAARKVTRRSILPLTGESDMEPNVSLDLEVVEIEHAGKPGCSGSSSTRPHCTCPVSVDDEE